jgi:hypothetical protein
MSDGKVGLVELSAFALSQPILQLARIHTVNEIERTISQLYGGARSSLATCIEINSFLLAIGITITSRLVGKDRRDYRERSTCEHQNRMNEAHGYSPAEQQPHSLLRPQ